MLLPSCTKCSHTNRLQHVLLLLLLLLLSCSQSIKL